MGFNLLNKLVPPPDELVSEFAERECYLSPETSSKTGRWENISYQVGMMNVANNPPKSRIAIFMTSTQVGKTVILKNLITYFIAGGFGGGITFLLPSEAMAKDYSKTHIATMIRDTPILRGIIAGANKHGNTLLMKVWPGGYLRMIGSQVADKISSFASPFLICDELDRCATKAVNSAGHSEGNPIALFLERFKNWPQRFAIFTSTPTVAGISAIEEWWDKSDQRLPLIPCPHCNHSQFLDWERISWELKR